MATPPSEQELDTARALCRDAVQVFQHRKGWCGWVVAGDTIMVEQRVRVEIGRLVAKLPSVWEAGKTKGCAGLSKRLSLLLRGFSAHPSGAELSELANSLDRGRREAPSAQTLEAITRWLDVNPAAETS